MLCWACPSVPPGQAVATRRATLKPFRAQTSAPSFTLHPMAALDLIVAYATRNYTFRFIRNAVLQDYNISNPQHTLYNDF